MNTFETMMDNWMENVGTLNWAQEQNEKTLRSYIDQGAQARTGGLKVAEKILDQTKKNVALFEKMVQDNMNNSLETLKKAHQMQVESAGKMMAAFGPQKVANGKK